MSRMMSQVLEQKVLRVTIVAKVGPSQDCQLLIEILNNIAGRELWRYYFMRFKQHLAEATCSTASSGK